MREYINHILLWMTAFVFLSLDIVLLCILALSPNKRTDQLYYAIGDDDLYISVHYKIVLLSLALHLCKRLILLLFVTTFVYLSTIIVLLCRTVFLYVRELINLIVNDDLFISFYDYSSSLQSCVPK